MSIIAQSYIWSQAKNLSDRALIVGLAIADHHNKKTGQCNPGISKHLVPQIGKCKKTILKGINELEEYGGVTVTKRQKNGANLSNLYAFPGCKTWQGWCPEVTTGGDPSSPGGGDPWVTSTGSNEPEVDPELEKSTTVAPLPCAIEKPTEQKNLREQGETLALKYKRACQTDTKEQKARIAFTMNCGRLHFPESKLFARTHGQTDGQLHDLRVWFDGFPTTGCEMINFGMSNWSALREKYFIKNPTPTISALSKIEPKAWLAEYQAAQRDAMLNRVAVHAEPEDDFTFVSGQTQAVA